MNYDREVGQSMGVRISSFGVSEVHEDHIHSSVQYVIYLDRSAVYESTHIPINGSDQELP